MSSQKKLLGTASQFNVYWDSTAGQAVIQPGVAYTGNKEAEPTAEVTKEFTPEQQALAEDFVSMVEEYNVIINKINENAELLGDEELVNAMNELTEAINKADEYFTSPESLTPEVMSAL
ncbi:MAG: hypothetical protein GX299_10880, partial [Epulopiscium sp.]|nr:hypothetical protein [Candidatus Epulonipiscium sp.]